MTFSLLGARVPHRFCPLGAKVPWHFHSREPKFHDIFTSEETENFCMVVARWLKLLQCGLVPCIRLCSLCETQSEVGGLTLH